LELGQLFGVGSRQGIPFCFLDEFRAWSDGVKLSNSALAEDGPQKQRGPTCDDCRFSNYCNGLWRPYAAKYGFDELRPIAGPKLTAHEVEELNVFARRYAWGEPRSFDEVSPLLREPELETGPPQVAAPPAGVSMPEFVAQRSRPLRVALLGSGRQARRLARNAREVAGLSIDAVASPHAPQSDLREFGDCPAYSDAASALDDIRPEAVIIAAATDAHDALARVALARAIPALLEKPVTRTEEEAVALRDAATAAGACIVPAHNALYASGIDELLAIEVARPAVSYVVRRTPRSGDAMRTWNRSSLYETVYHLLVVVGRASGGGVGQVVKAAFRGDASPEHIRLHLQYDDAPAEIVLDLAAALEEDVLSRGELGAPASEQVWRRQGRTITITSADGVRTVEARGNDVQRMLANFRDVVLGLAPPGASLEEAIDVMRTARRVVEALSDAGAPFDRPNAPRHVASRALQPAFR
jgi:predicted dehydrogenase